MSIAFIMDDYERCLERARSQIPADAFKRSGERFQIPEVEAIIQGNRTFWQNFQQIIDILNRPGKEVAKYVAGQLATGSVIEGGNAIFNGKFSSEEINRILWEYIRQYIICPVCGRPDTTETKESGAYYLVCSACGARTAIRPI